MRKKQVSMSLSLKEKEKYVLDKRKENSTPYVFNLKATKK